VDLQVHGHAGVDFNDAMITAEALDLALEAMLRAGVVACLPTLVTAHGADLAARLAALDRAVAQSRLGGLMVPGYHLAGPFLQQEAGYAGCHPAECMIPPDPALVARLEAGLARPILALTVAAELDGAAELIAWAHARGKIVAIGHSDARFEHVLRAADAGACLSAQLGAALPGSVAPLDNTLMAQLAEDRLFASFVADGVHAPPFALKSLVRAKGVHRAIMVTGATAAAAAEPGWYPFADAEVLHEGDLVVRTQCGQAPAGSALTLDQAVRNLVRWRIATPAEAVQMAGGNPAALLARHGAAIPEAELEWSNDLRVLRVRLGDIELKPASLPAFVA
jgi:N-acetylglucosamine-6-phosphate deacetylase